MMIILFVQPSKHSRFYKNPHRLQAICWEASSLTTQCDFQIWDRDTSSIPPKRCLVMVIDALEASLEDIYICIDTIKTEYIIMVDDIYDYCAHIKQLDCQYKLFSLTLSQVTETICNIVGKSVVNDSMQRQLLLPPSICDEYIKRGIQYFSEGVARGCEGDCSFCKLSCSKISNKIQTVPYCSAEMIAKVSSILPPPLFVQFSDENFFGNNSDRLKQVYSLAQKLYNQGFKGIIGVDTRVDSIPCNTTGTNSLRSLQALCWEMMIKAGLRYCFVGVESFSMSQALRYHKLIQHHDIINAISFFEKNNLLYTFGLILWEPHMSQDDILININSIKSLNLIGKTASLLKPLRIIPGSKYEKIYCNNLTPMYMPHGGTKKWDHIATLYNDYKIRLMARLLFPIYGAFNDAGYRHSDVSLFEATFTSSTPNILYEIPKRIAEMELSLIEALYVLEIHQLEKLSVMELLPICFNVVQNIQSQLKTLITINPTDVRPVDYYSKAFKSVLKNLNDLKTHYTVGINKESY